MSAMISTARARDTFLSLVDGLVGARDIEPAEPLNHLYRYLVGSGFILPKELAGT
jgi:hypothetical protein